MKRILILIIGLIGVAYGQSSPTSAKTRFVNGIYLGTKLDSYFAAADSNAIYWRADSALMAKYKGTARALAFDVTGGYKPISDTFFTNGYTTRARTKQQIDSLSNAVANGFVTLGTIQTITAQKTFTSSILNTGGFISTSAASNPTLRISNTTSGVSWDIFNNSSSNLVFNNGAGSGVSFGSSSDITALAYKVTGGTSSQFLKADGSVDGTSYATAASLSGYLPLSGGTLTGALNGTSAFFNSGIDVRGAANSVSVYPFDFVASSSLGNALVGRFGAVSGMTNGLQAIVNNTNTAVDFIFNGALNGTSLSMSGVISNTDVIRANTNNANGTATIRTFFNNTAIAQFANNLFVADASKYGFMQGSDGTNYIGGLKNVVENGALLVNTSTDDGTNKLIVNGGVKANNVYLGTSSFLTSTSANIFQVGDRGVIENVVGNQMMVSNNAYYDGSNWKYISTAPASAIRFGSTVQGDISFHSAASGTAGTNITNWDGTDVKLYIAPSGAATFSSSVTATGATLDRTATGSNYLNIKALNSAANDIAVYFGDGTNNVYAGMMRGTAGSADAAFHIHTGGSIRFTVASTGAATFSSSVTASSFIRSGGTSSQALMADGSVQTVTSGTYNPTLTGVTNISSITLDDANFTRVGSVVNVYISGTVQTTAAGATSFTATLPINATGSTYIGFGNVNNGTADGTAGIVSAASTTTLTFDFNSINTTSRRFSISFQYSL